MQPTSAQYSLPERKTNSIRRVVGAIGRVHIFEGVIEARQRASWSVICQSVLASFYSDNEHKSGKQITTNKKLSIKQSYLAVVSKTTAMANY